MKAVRAAAILSLTLVVGCSSLSERECRAGNWDAQGFEDATAGQAESRLQQHQDSCGRHAVPVDAAAYKAGHERGRKVYCTAAGGYVAGRSGDSDPGFCSGADAGIFKEAFRAGREMHERLRELQATARQLEELEQAGFRSSSNEDRTRLRMREAEVRRRQDRLRSDIASADRRYSLKFGAPPLSAQDLWSQGRF